MRVGLADVVILIVVVFGVVIATFGVPVTVFGIAIVIVVGFSDPHDNSGGSEHRTGLACEEVHLPITALRKTEDGETEGRPAFHGEFLNLMIWSTEDVEMALDR